MTRRCWYFFFSFADGATNFCVLGGFDVEVLIPG